MPRAAASGDGIELEGAVEPLAGLQRQRQLHLSRRADQQVAGDARLARGAAAAQHSANLAAYGNAGRLHAGARALAYVGKRRDKDFDLFPAHRDARTIMCWPRCASASGSTAGARGLCAGRKCVRRRLSGRGRLSHAGTDGLCGPSRSLLAISLALAAAPAERRRGGWRRSTCAPTSCCCCSPRRGRSPRSRTSSAGSAETPLWRAGAALSRAMTAAWCRWSALRPDLVLTMGGGARDRAGIAGAARHPHARPALSAKLDDIDGEHRQCRRGARAGPRPAQAASRRIEALAAQPPPSRPRHDLARRRRPDGRAPASAAQWMGLAGLRQRPLAGDRVIARATAGRARPPCCCAATIAAGQYSSEQRWLAHPLARAARPSRTLATDGRLWTCMGPLMIARDRAAAARGGR